MAKLIKEIHDLIDYVGDKGHTAPQRRREIDQAVYEASMSLFNEYLGQYELTSTIHEYLAPFEIIEDYDDPVNITAPNLYKKPDDYARYTMILTKDAPTITKGLKVTVINNAMWANRTQDPNEGPDFDHPIARLGSTFIEVLPQNVLILLYYLKTPIKPKYLTDVQGNYDDAGSTDVEWNATLFHRLANRACSKLGINLREQQIVQYSEVMKQTGN
jgi:hypothetical protein